MAAQEPTFNQISKRVGVNLVAEGIKHLLLWSVPFLIAGLTVAAGYFQSVPVMYIVVAASIAFGAAATGVLRVSELRARITAQNKLIFQQIIPSADFIKDKRTGKIKEIQRVQFGIALQNNAHFPVSYIIDEISTSFESTVNPKPDRSVRGADIPPGTVSWYRDTPIELKSFAITKSLYEGTIRFKLRYGLPGNEKFPIERNLLITLVSDDKTGGFSQIHTSDVVESINRQV